jgi:membrane fusion protein, copper/silver efflux system
MKIVSNIFAALLLLSIAACSRTATPSKPADVDYYTCTMHTFVHVNAPGKCPVCSMDLVPVMKRNVERKSVERGATSEPSDASRSSAPRSTSDMPGMPGMQGGNQMSGASSPEFVVPIERQQQIGVTYATVERKPLSHTIRAVGMVEADLQKHWAFVARVDGYVQQLFVTSPGQLVEKDAPLMSIYSPDLFTTEREFVMLLRMRDEAKTKDARETPERLIAAAKTRLQQWNVTGEQIADLEKTRKPAEVFTLRSPFRGVVQEVPAHQGVTVRIGDHLVDVADLSVVWVWADFYENELSMLKQDQKVGVTAKSYPGETFQGQVAVINPFLDEAKRTSRVRIDIPNPDFKLRPGMYANVELAMDMGEALTIPVSAVMPTGTRNVVFVDKGEGKLEPRIVQLGAKYGDLYEVRGGLRRAERVVSSANFLIDAESKVQGALKDFEERGAESGERVKP